MSLSAIRPVALLPRHSGVSYASSRSVTLGLMLSLMEEGLVQVLEVSPATVPEHDSVVLTFRASHDDALRKVGPLLLWIEPGIRQRLRSHPDALNAQRAKQILEMFATAARTFQQVELQDAKRLLTRVETLKDELIEKLLSECTGNKGSLPRLHREMLCCDDALRQEIAVSCGRERIQQLLR